jgi:hypothetical protein
MDLGELFICYILLEKHWKIIIYEILFHILYFTEIPRLKVYTVQYKTHHTKRLIFHEMSYSYERNRLCAKNENQKRFERSYRPVCTELS